MDGGPCSSSISSGGRVCPRARGCCERSAARDAMRARRHPRNTTWNTHFAQLFIDNPGGCWCCCGARPRASRVQPRRAVGAGYSYSGTGYGYANSSLDYARDLYNFMVVFYGAPRPRPRCARVCVRGAARVGAQRAGSKSSEHRLRSRMLNRGARRGVPRDAAE